MKKIILKTTYGAQWKVYILVLVTVCLTSCASRKRQEDTVKVEVGFNATVVNEPYETKNSDLSTFNRYNLLHMLNIYDKDIDTIMMNFKNKNELIITYVEEIGSIHKTESAIFKGKFKKDGSFQIFLEKRRLQVPPVIPVLYNQVHIDKVMMSMTKDGNLLLENYYKREGSVLIIGGGNTFKYSQKFKIID
ncbi:hypothetical protein [Dokdonia sp.]|uniref:hypothetical protein n=1 Tax=Dokdonia sp. TaxID=2024995 RepID=UPI00326763BD